VADLNWTAADLPSIAPSLANAPLPVLALSGASADAAAAVPDLAPPPPGGAAAPPPPPPPAPPSSSAAAPPPPSAAAAPPDAPPESSGDGRSALLQAIQKGKTLKKAAERVIRENKAKKPEKKSAEDTSLDLNAALKERMALRRKGISGSRKGVEEEEASGAASAAAAGDSVPRMPTIGEPPRPVAESSMSNDDGDDDDDNAPISMKGMRLSLQASQANLLAKAGQADEGDDEDWDD
jgi:hypothetical protein